jgi:hypothetical protein
MLRIFSLIFILTSIGMGATTDEITQFAITWTFDGQYEYGQFANGDYWVVGPVTIININPASVVTAGRTTNGSMLDPNSGQGFDSAKSPYTAAKNVARPGGKVVLENRVLTFDVNATDADGDPLVYDVVGEEAGATFSVKTFTWRPTYQQAGIYVITVSVTDGEKWDYDNVNVTVTNVAQYFIGVQ